ncbi:MAG TPA: hypothetical protein VK204_02920 [Nocardioidaceae bacterium]|nr:hypothetical protein [Nocardioidaceae bacterium]
MRKPLVAGAAIAAFGLASAIGPTAVADPGGSGCQLDGTATFTPNGPGNLGTFGYSLTGALSSCSSSRAGAPTEGTMAVGDVITVAVPITTPTGVVQGTAQYQEPLASGTGTVPVNSCGASSTEGTAFIGWPDGTATVVDYTTSAAGPMVSLQGTVVPGATAALVPGSEQPAGSAPATYEIATDNPTTPAGDGVQGAVAFTTDAPDACTTDTGLTGVTVSGAVGLGSTQ